MSKKVILILVLVVLLSSSAIGLSAWAIWGNQDSGQSTLCQDALERRKIMMETMVESTKQSQWNHFLHNSTRNAVEGDIAKYCK